MDFNFVQLSPSSTSSLLSGRERKRSRRRDKLNWTTVKNQIKRMRGEEHMQQKRAGKADKIKPPRQLGPPCASKECGVRKSRHCQEFTEETRLSILHRFWNELDWGQKKVFVMGNVFKHKAKRSLVDHRSCRQESFHYFLSNNGEKVEVCRKFFLSTVSLGNKQVRNWVSKGEISRKTRQPPSKPISDKKQGAIRFLDTLPKLPSHYCRKDTSKLYLEPLFTSFADLYRAYTEYCGSNNLVPVSTFTLSNLVDEKNIGLYSPKKDQCDICCSFEAGNLLEKDHKVHIERKKAARDARDNDKLDAMCGNVHVVEMDVQAVKLAPVLNASALYYKTKLMVHNFTVCDLATMDATCFLWDESEGELVASVFTSCLIEYLQRFKDDKPIIIFSDGCTNQNRNSILSTGLLDLAMKQRKTIIQKILEKGHTQMEVDSVHATIERKLKGQSIYEPAAYIGICEKARINPRAYEVKYKKFSEFTDYSRPKNQRYSSIRPGTKAGDFCVTDLRQIKYNPNGTIEYKLDYKSDWKPLPRKPKDADSNFPSLYSSRRPISKRKYQDLQDILHVIPIEFHNFYRSLPHD